MNPYYAAFYPVRLHAYAPMKREHRFESGVWYADVEFQCMSCGEVAKTHHPGNFLISTAACPGPPTAPVSAAIFICAHGWKHEECPECVRDDCTCPTCVPPEPIVDF